jgi:Holliday junction resolvase-like predicted endonuclease
MSELAGLTENDVVDAVCEFLEEQGSTIISRALTTERGPDIEARLPAGTSLFVEAKGATSARAGSARYGQMFESSAVRVHVAEAFYAAAATASDASRSALALPDNAFHRRYLEPVRSAMDGLDLGVFWVSETGSVDLVAAWSLDE